MASTLAERVRMVREERGLGVNELDRLAGVGKGYTSRVEGGARGRISSDLIHRYGTWGRNGATTTHRTLNGPRQQNPQR